ncbi:MAG: RND transporter [Desulfuromonadaceae bacterium GWB2_53_15]|nr:MAG: RND transporter [Desulfuromonadaceae bacterium GWB2_53_15]
MKRFLLLFVLLIPTLPTYAATSLTLDEALATALKNHPQIIEAKETLYAAGTKTGQALANYYPQISVAADWSRGQTFFAAQESIRLSQTNSAGLYLKQTIYDFGRTAGAADAARGNREAADKALTVTRQDLSLRVSSAFYLLLATEKQVIAVSETVRARDQVYQQAQEFFNQGIRSKVDLARAEANLFAAKTTQIRAENNREIARVELANAMGLAYLGERTLLEPLPPAQQLPERSQVQQDAFRNRSELQQLSALKMSAAANLKSARGSYLPVLTGTASAGYADRDFPPSGNVWGVGLNLSIPLFSGFSSVEQVREANANINIIEARQNSLKLQITKEADSAWLGANEAVARMVSTQKEVAAANESKALAEGRYQEGVGSIIEVTDAQSQALDAQTANIQARYDYYTALARLDRAIGKQ